MSFFLCAIPLIAVLESPLAQAYYGYAKYPALGPHKLGVILVKVPEIENEHTPAYVDNLVFGEVNNFFKEASYGQFWLEGKTTSKWYDLLRGDYYKENFFGLDKDEEFVQEAIDLARSEIDTSDYDQILIIQERMTVPPAGFEGYYDPPGMSVAVIGYTNWFAIAHELAHGLGPELGLPDLYRQEVAEINDWSLMGGFGGPLAWEKILLGWVPPSRILTVNLGETITSWVDPLEINTDNIQVIKIPMSNNHFFLVEVRQQIGSDSGVVPGVLISFASDGTGNFEMTYVPQATFSLAPVLEIEERRLNVTALDAEENNVSIRVDVYLNGRYVGETSEISYSSPYGFRVYTRGAHVLTLQETDTYGNRFGRWAPNPAGNTLVVGPGFPVPFSPEPPLEMMATGYYGTPDPPKNAIFIMGYYAFQEGDRISVSDLNLTITVLEENESGSYLIRVGPELSIQQDDAGSAGDAGGGTHRSRYRQAATTAT